MADTENGAAKEADPDAPPSLLRPSTFVPKPGILAPSRLGGANPFVAKPPCQNSSSSTEGGGGVAPGLGSGNLSQNPFANIVSSQAAPASNSDSEGATGNGTAPSKTFLRPSTLDHHTANFGKVGTTVENPYKSSFKLEPAKLQSPFRASKVPVGGRDDESSEAEAAAPATSASGEAAAEQRVVAKAPPDDHAGDAGDSSAKVDESSEEAKPSASSKQPADDCPDDKPDSGGTQFVFGQNMDERVANTTPTMPGAEDASFVFGENIGDRVTSTTKSPDTPEQATSPPAAANDDTPNKTLAESAAAHQAKHAPPELHEVEVKTGEENESNVFQINAKLFAFDKLKQSWLEKGRGLLRLNDMSENGETSFRSRLVMRTQGSLRVVLNTKIWAAMTVDRASPKSVRITAVDPDDGSVRVFLVMANPKDADQIFSAIDWRVQQLKARESTAEGGEPDAGPSEAEAQLPKAATSSPQAEKRPNEDSPEESAARAKKVRVDPSERRDILTEESNDSSTIDPETEASNESFSSTYKSSSSE